MASKKLSKINFLEFGCGNVSRFFIYLFPNPMKDDRGVTKSKIAGFVYHKGESMKQTNLAKTILVCTKLSNCTMPKIGKSLANENSKFTLIRMILNILCQALKSDVAQFDEQKSQEQNRETVRDSVFKP